MSLATGCLRSEKLGDCHCSMRQNETRNEAGDGCFRSLQPWWYTVCLILSNREPRRDVEGSVGSNSHFRKIYGAAMER